MVKHIWSSLTQCTPSSLRKVCIYLNVPVADYTNATSSIKLKRLISKRIGELSSSVFENLNIKAVRALCDALGVENTGSKLRMFARIQLKMQAIHSEMKNTRKSKTTSHQHDSQQQHDSTEIFDLSEQHDLHQTEEQHDIFSILQIQTQLEQQQIQEQQLEQQRIEQQQIATQETPSQQNEIIILDDSQEDDLYSELFDDNFKFPLDINNVATEAEKQHPQQIAIHDYTEQQKKIGLPSMECVICMDKAKDTIFRSCKHLVACNDCAKRIMSDTRECPICRKITKKIYQIYNA